MDPHNAPDEGRPLGATPEAQPVTPRYDAARRYETWRGASAASRRTALS
ncbi:MAG: hypothetical protein ACTS6J_14730 [Burkholderiales bacterium]